ncbi:hypothetical protein K438DRAFT_1753832 [Mycena galopus ATCC 62051]|nr:hypothetical protein K438DRAFT_1753832 [Mycena galopus ATCC 62051]
MCQKMVIQWPIASGGIAGYRWVPLGSSRIARPFAAEVGTEESSLGWIVSETRTSAGSLWGSGTIPTPKGTDDTPTSAGARRRATGDARRIGVRYGRATGDGRRLAIGITELQTIQCSIIHQLEYSEEVLDFPEHLPSSGRASEIEGTRFRDDWTRIEGARGKRKSAPKKGPKREKSGRALCSANSSNQTGPKKGAEKNPT